MAHNIAYISVGVADMDVARKLWVDSLGLEILARRSGPDAELGKLWGLPGEEFADQLLLGTPGASSGRLHLVQFVNPGSAVRESAQPTDLGAKNIDVNCVGMPQLVDGLRKRGYTFRSAIGEYEVDDIRAREVQMPAHDGVNVVFIEILTSGYEVGYTTTGYAAMTSFVVIVPDTLAEAGFYRDVFGLDELMHHRISGAGIEQAAGLPPGTVLDMRLCGEDDNLFGRMELIAYEGITGADRFSAARPPATGILRCGFTTTSLDKAARRAADVAVQMTRLPAADTIVGAGEYAVLTSPAGLTIELFAPA